MLPKLLIAGLLMGLCVVIHAGGLMAALRWLNRRAGPGNARFLPATSMLVGIAGWSILLHLMQITVWALYYAASGAIPDFAAALYFSAVTYTTTGYGDVVLPEGWRLVGGVEALTGILMCGLSTGLFFAVFGKLVNAPSGNYGSRASR